MGREEWAQAQEEQLEQATQQATDLIRAFRDDPEARVRLLLTTGTGDAAIYHFDAFWPTQNEQSRVIVQHTGVGSWQARFVEDSPVAPSMR